MDVLGNGGLRGSFRQKLRQSQSRVGDGGDKSEQVGKERVECSDQAVPVITVGIFLQLTNLAWLRNCEKIMF